MTREEQLLFCKICKNRKLDVHQGIICSLTGEKADFENSCEQFNKDEVAAKELIEREVTLNQEVASADIGNQLSEDVLDKLRDHQDLTFALIGGFALSILSAMIWAGITISTEYQIGWMAIGVGVAVGFGVRFFGSGVDQIFGILGAVFSLLGCLLGNIISQAYFIGLSQSMGVFEVLSILGISGITDLLSEITVGMDLLFYGLAIFEGYKFAFRTVTPEIINGDLKPKNANLKLPLTIASACIVAVSLYLLKGESEGKKTIFDEQGNKQSSGEFSNGFPHGLWQYFYTDGAVAVAGNYEEGVEYGEWNWFDEQGNHQRLVNYEAGLMHGTEINFYQNGQPNDSGAYEYGRKTGLWKIWHSTGTLNQKGNYYRDQFSGEWAIYNEEGNLISEILFTAGIVQKQTDYYPSGNKKISYATDEEHSLLIKEIRNAEGKILITKGSGNYQGSMFNENFIDSGRIENGKMVDFWTQYSINGNKTAELFYEDDNIFALNTWDQQGRQMVINKNGTHSVYFPETEIVNEEGNIQEGQRTGKWTSYYEDGQTILSETNYTKGVENGNYTTYYFSGVVQVEGIFKNGKQDGIWNWYFENGQLESTTFFVDGKKSGIQQMYNEIGIHVKDESYTDGKLDYEKIIQLKE